MRRYSFEGVVASALFIVLFAVLMIQIFGRTPLFRGPVWTEEAARLIWRVLAMGRECYRSVGASARAVEWGCIS